MKHVFWLYARVTKFQHSLLWHCHLGLQVKGGGGVSHEQKGWTDPSVAFLRHTLIVQPELWFISLVVIFTQEGITPPQLSRFISLIKISLLQLFISFLHRVMLFSQEATSFPWCLVGIWGWSSPGKCQYLSDCPNSNGEGEGQRSVFCSGL